jgi:hypothetical protein
MCRAERSTAGKLGVVGVVVTVLDGVEGLSVADVAASFVVGLAPLLQDATRIAATTAPLLAPELLR